MYYFKTIIIDGIALTCPRGGCNDPGTFATHSCHMYTQENHLHRMCACAQKQCCEPSVPVLYVAWQ